MWYPFNHGDLPTQPVDGADNIAVAVKEADAPNPTELTNWLQSEKDLSVNEALTLGFAPFSLDEKGDHRTIVLDAMRYVDKENVRWGIGLRFTLHAWTEDGTVKGSVALVAAQASLNLAYTRASLQVLGFNSPDLATTLPGFEEMTVSNYGELMKSLDACRSIVLKGEAKDLKPTPIAISLPNPIVEPEGVGHRILNIFHHSR